MKFDEVRNRCIELRTANEGRIKEFLKRNVPAKMISDVYENGLGRTVEYYCPHCGSYNKGNNVTVCSVCGKNVSVNSYKPGSDEQFAVILAEDGNGDVYAYYGYAESQVGYKPDNTAYIISTAYTDRGFGVYTADRKKYIFDSNGCRKGNSWRVFSYGGTNIDLSGNGIWGVAMPQSDLYRFWNSVDRLAAAGTASRRNGTAVNTDIVCRDIEPSDIAPLIFSEISSDNIRGTMHYEVWCTGCGEIFETDIPGGGKAVCPNCGASSENRLGRWDNNVIQINRNGNDIDIVKTAFTVEGFEVVQRPKCAYKINSKGKATSYAYENGWKKTSAKSVFRWGGIYGIIIDPDLSELNIEGFAESSRDGFFNSVLAIRRYVEAAVRNPLVRDITGNCEAMYVLASMPELLNLKADSVPGLFGMTEDIWDFTVSSGLDIPRVRNITECFPGCDRKFLSFIFSSCCDAEKIREAFDRTSCTRDEFMEYCRRQSLDGLSVCATADLLLKYFSEIENNNLQSVFGLPYFPEHLLIAESQAARASSCVSCCQWTDISTGDSFADHFAEFTYNQLVVTASIARFSGRARRYDRDRDSGSLLVFDEDGSLLGTVAPDGSEV